MRLGCLKNSHLTTKFLLDREAYSGPLSHYTCFPLRWNRLPTDIQAEGIPLVLGGGDVLMAAETGSGKTAAFCLPVIQVVWEALKDIESGKEGEGTVKKCKHTFPISLVARPDFERNLPDYLTKLFARARS